MATKIFVNLPLKDLDQSKEFFNNIGFTINQQFTDETAACVVIPEDIYAMILTYAKFRKFTKKEIADATKTTEVLTCLSCESKDKVNETLNKAIAAGATEARDPMDYGFMYARSFNDPDAHIWEIMWTDPGAVNQS